jgi:hypothetical protein
MTPLRDFQFRPIKDKNRTAFECKKNFCFCEEGTSLNQIGKYPGFSISETERPSKITYGVREEAICSILEKEG